MIYIREAHPTDGWDVGALYRTRDPVTLEERRAVATACEASLRYGMPTYVDDVDDAVMRAYAAWPERIYLIGADQRVIYRGGLGPQGFKPEALEAAIEQLSNVLDHEVERV